MELKKDTILKYIRTSIGLFLVIAVGIAGCDEDNGLGPDPEPGSNIVEIAGEDSELSTFSEALVETGLDSELKSDGPYTVFAPVDSAFDKLPEGFMDNLTEDQIKEVISYHILSGAMVESDIQGENSIEAIAGGSLFVKAENDIELNHKAALTEGDTEASNGVIHKIDNVLVPDSYLTVFGIIQKRYALAKFACHCTSGRTNLDQVLENEDSEFTVFVPTDEAFENFGDTESLSDSELEHRLSYHIIEQKILSDQFTDGETLTTLNGEDITISVASDGTISLNGDRAVVQEADLEGKNGVVYIVDSVVTHEM